MNNNIEGKTVRKRMHQPSTAFLQHTLAVAELNVQLFELAAEGKIGIAARQLEPDSWRRYTNVGGTASTLRPDLFAITTTVGGEYEDHWFFEVDLATESPSVIIRKCQQYLSYLRSGEEQKLYGVFPLVVWVVPDDKRCGSLKAHLTDSLTGDEACVFVVITMEQLERLVVADKIDE